MRAERISAIHQTLLMKALPHVRTRLLVLGLLAVLSPISPAGYPPMVPTLQPYRVSSPQGTWQLDVKPCNREGAGPATTTLTNSATGEIAWKRMLPYTFWQCCVNEAGVVGGYAYTKGVMGKRDPDQDAGHFVISFLDVGGVSMHEERTHRPPSSVGMGYYVPAHWAHRLLLDANNDRMILLMPDGLFRSHSMRDGTLNAAFIPESQGDASGYEWPDKILFFQGNPLMLLESNSAWGNSTETRSTSCIQLIDGAGRTLWATSRHRTYGADKEWPFPKFRILDPEPPVVTDPFAEKPSTDQIDPFAESDPFAEEDEVPEPADPPSPAWIATFDAWFGDTEEKATFHILESEDDDQTPSYQVLEVSREKWTLPEERPAEEDPFPPVDFPRVGAKRIASFQLHSADGAPLSGLAAVTLGPESTIHALASDGGLVHIFGSEGKLLRTADPGQEHTIDTSHYSACIAVDGKGEFFVRISDGYGDEEDERDSHAGHYLRFSADGKRTTKVLVPPSDEFSGHLVSQPHVDKLIFFGYGNEVAVSNRDPYGSRAATLSHRKDGQWLEHILDVACAPNGLIAVRDSSQGDTSGGFTTPFPRLPNHLPAETITIYEADGDPVRTIDFSRFAGLSRIAFDGKRIAATFPHNPPTPLVYLFDSEGTPLGAIRIEELADQEQVNLQPFIVSEGTEIMAIDKASGRVFRFRMP